VACGTDALDQGRAGECALLSAKVISYGPAEDEHVVKTVQSSRTRLFECRTVLRP
jgi:hypothetical protein